MPRLVQKGDVDDVYVIQHEIIVELHSVPYPHHFLCEECKYLKLRSPRSYFSCLISPTALVFKYLFCAVLGRNMVIKALR